MDPTSSNDSTSPGKKRKLSTHADLPGPSYAKCTQPIPKDTPMSEFYHSLLESTYEEDMNSMYLNIAIFSLNCTSIFF